MQQTVATPLSDQQVATLLNETVTHLNRREFAPAERLLDILLSARPDDANALLVLGQVRRVQNRLLEAEGLYRKVVALDPLRAEVHYNLGQVLNLGPRVDDAISSLNEAIRLKANFAEAYFELGTAHSRKLDFVAAEEAYQQALRQQPNMLPARHGLSSTLISLGRPKEAEAVARSALAQAANDMRWYAAFKHNIAIAISEQHRFEEAVAAYEEVQAIAPTLPFLDLNSANALQALGRVEDAEITYRRALERAPLDLMTHRGLNHLLWRADRPEFLASYDDAAARYPNQGGLFVEKGRTLLAHERYDQALEAFDRALSISPNDEVAREGRASALARLGRFEDAIEEFKSVVARRPNSAEVRCGLAETYVRAGESARALAVLDETLALAPHSQFALALRDTARRQGGVDHVDDDYERFIRIYDLAAPEGYEDMASFNRSLASYLGRLHGDVPAETSELRRLVNRTTGSLFGAGAEIIASLRSHLDKAISAHVNQLPADAAHPFVSRRFEALRYSGSWSTRAVHGAPIANHIHDAGWLSGIYFVALPDDVTNASNQPGWSKFGEPPFDAHIPKPVRATVQPVAGRLVLFPSYLWHGSLPFRGQQSRLSVAFDTVPERVRHE